MIRPTIISKAGLIRPIATSGVVNLPYQEGPERDLVNFPRIKMLENPPPTKLGFIPASWFTYFYPKTGVTGPYMFLGGLTTYLMSKEIWVLEHEFWGGVSFFIMIIYATKKFGPKLGAYIDAQMDKEDALLNEGKMVEINAAKDGIKDEEHAQWQAEGEKMLFDVKRENVGLQVEANYRERMMTVFSEVKKRLDYQVEVQQVERNVAQKHMVNWIISKVRGSITPQSEQENIKKCIADLKGLAAKA